MRFGLPKRQTEREDFAAEPQSTLKKRAVTAGEPQNAQKKDRRCGPG